MGSCQYTWKRKVKGDIKMSVFLKMSLLVIFGLIALTILLIMVFSKKIKVENCKVVYWTLILFPIIMLAPPILISNPFRIANGSELASIPMFLYCGQILIIMISILIGANISPWILNRFKERGKSNLIKIASGIKLLHYSIFINILYLLPTLIVTLVLISKIDIGSWLFAIIFACIFFWPIALITCVGYMVLLVQLETLIVIIMITIVTLYIIALVTSINGITRIYGKNKNLIKYIALMFIPITNLISMLYVCHKAKEGGHIL
jgi:hypothetical protein